MLNISDEEFNSIKDLMHAKTGVFLRPTKKPLVLSRLRRRLKELHLSNFTSYIKLLEDPRGNEYDVFINAITTNETYFFRHTRQFNYLFQTGFPALMARKQSSRKEIRIWSAACSTGEEPYSIAITCRHFFMKHPGWRYKIWASDINTEVLKEAMEATYPERSLRETPASLRQKHFHLAEIKKTHSVTREFTLDASVKKDVEFIQHNLLKPFGPKDMDVIFLRNVMIYFDNETKQKVVRLMENHLVPGGYFIVSLSESLNDVKSQLEFVETSIYRKREA